MDIVAATKLSDVLKPQARGEPVNTHVVQPVAEPEPDFEAMRRLTTGQSSQVAIDQHQNQP